MLPDRVSNPRPLTYESGTLPIALRSPATGHWCKVGKNETETINTRLEKTKVVTVESV